MCVQRHDLRKCRLVHKVHPSVRPNDVLEMILCSNENLVRFKVRQEAQALQAGDVKLLSERDVVLTGERSDPVQSDLGAQVGAAGVEISEKPACRHNTGISHVLKDLFNVGVHSFAANSLELKNMVVSRHQLPPSMAVVLEPFVRDSAANSVIASKVRLEEARPVVRVAAELAPLEVLPIVRIFKQIAGVLKIRVPGLIVGVWRRTVATPRDLERTFRIPHHANDAILVTVLAECLGTASVEPVADEKSCSGSWLSDAIILSEVRDAVNLGQRVQVSGSSSGSCSLHENGLRNGHSITNHLL
mmetsp:Transcript_7802/g.23581  ORF Transcript_7802/g.23581 Transcript_7802/m.23581 type:complete len:302 (-) Transcript_7802:619-1524(-)